MSTSHDSYVSVGQMSVADSDYGLACFQAQYCPPAFNSSGYLAPDATLSQFPLLPMAGDHQQLGINIPALRPLESFVPARPHSSPSTFGPNEQDLIWNGMLHHRPSFQCSAPIDQGMLQPYQPTTFPPIKAPMPRHRYSTSSTSVSVSDIKTPQPRRLYPVIAPNPGQKTCIKTNPPKRQSPEIAEEDAPPEVPTKRRRRTSPTPISASSAELSDEDRLLLRLKDEEHVTWKDIAARFQAELGKVYQVPALQMRLKRLRERLRVWTESDVAALRMAHEYWERKKFDIIAARIGELDASEKWTARECARKWQDLNPGVDVGAMQAVATPAFSYPSSPTEHASPTFAPPLPLVGLLHSR